MKAAMWALGLIGLGVFAILLVNLFGNITVTNQQNYTLMKNSVEAAMYDSIDLAGYRAGFCICPNVPKTNVNGQDKWVFTSKSNYTIKDINNGSCDTGCELVEGEYKIDAKVFSESLVRRFAESVTSNKDYQVIVQDVSEYPPKVSVMIKSKDNQMINQEEFTITNQTDALFETR